MKDDYLIFEKKAGISDFVIVPSDYLILFSKKRAYREVGHISEDIFKKFGCSIFVDSGIDIHILGGSINATANEIYNSAYGLIDTSFTDASLYLGRFIHNLHGKNKIIESAYLVSDKEKLELKKMPNRYCFMLNNNPLEKKESDDLEYGVFDYFVRGNYFKGDFFLDKIGDLYNVRKKSILPWERKTTISFFE